MNAEEISNSFYLADRPIESYSDEELLIAFNESARGIPVGQIRKLILPQVYGGDLELSFNGQNCDDCSGWDGTSRRCNCGNRRVSWVVEEWVNEPYAYAEAY